MKTLIVIDMLNDFINETGALYCGQTARDIIPFIKNRINEYQKEENPIIFLQDSHDEDDKEFERFPPHAITGSWGSLTIPELKDFVITFLPKRRYSGFYNTGLEPLLRTINPLNITFADKIEVVGVCTSICVMDTVGDLANMDYKIIVPKACVADFDQDNHESALKRMKTLYGAEIV